MSVHHCATHGIMWHISSGGCPWCASEARVAALEAENEKLKAALRRAYRKSEVLDEPGYVLYTLCGPICDGHPDFDTIKSAFEGEGT